MGRWLAAIDRAIGRWPAIGLATAAAALAIWVVPYVRERHAAETNPGFLYIGSPQVFTRERLVNDRFMQASWLEDELRKTAKEPPGGISGASFSTRVENKADLTVGGPPDPGASGQEAPSAEKEQELSLEPRMAFERTLDLRERIRNSLMDAQLDDAHDMAGNTLYRMNFEAATVPFSNRRSHPGSALFVVTVEKDDDPDGQAELMNEFRKEMQNYFSNIIDYRLSSWAIQSNLTNPFDTQETMAFDSFLRRQLRLKIASYAEFAGVCYDTECSYIIPSDDESIARFVRQLILKANETSMILSTFDAMTTNVACRSLFLTRLPYLNDIQKSEAAKLFEPRIDKNRLCQPPIPSYQDVMLRTIGVMDQVILAIEDGRISPADAPKTGLQKHLANMVPPQACANEWLLREGTKLIRKELASIVSDVELHESAKAREIIMALPEDSVTGPASRDLVGSPCPEAVKAPAPCLPASSAVSAAQCLYLYTRSNFALRPMLAEFLWSRVTHDESMLAGYFSNDRDLIAHFDVSLKGCEAGACSLRISPKNGKTAKDFFDEVREHLPEEVRTYGIYPRALFSVGDISVSSESAAAAALQDVGLLFAQDRDHKARVAEPFVLGFIGGDDREPSTEATFGWIIRPRQSEPPYWLADHHNLSATVSVPSWWKQVRVVTRACWVPGFLASRLDFAELHGDPKEVCTKIGDERRKLKGATKQDANENEREYSVKLPGDVDAIMELFELDVLRAPYFEHNWLTNEAPRIVVEAGRPGKVVLVGERLWRSTVVTLMDIPASSIQVLPDMRGVVATFECIPPPPGQAFMSALPADVHASTSPHDEALPVAATSPLEATPASPDMSEGQVRHPSVPVRVWTSEGKTVVVSIKVAPFTMRTRDDRPCSPNAEENPRPVEAAATE